VAIQIITDSTSDLSLTQQTELGVEVIPLSVRFGDKEYLDGVTLSKEQFFKMLAECSTLPTTSQVSPGKFTDVFRNHINKGDEIIGIFISSKLSGTYQSAVIAKEVLDSESIYLVDSKTATFGLALLVYEAVKMRSEGHSASEICSAIGQLSTRLKFYAAIDTLKYFKMGGRLSSSSAFLGTMLHIKPIITITDGLIVSFDKKKGLKQAIERIAQQIAEEKPDDGYPMAFGDTDAPSLTQLLKDAVSAVVDVPSSETVTIGSVVGTHAGPGCTGVAYIARE